MVSINVLLKRLCLQNGDVNFRLRLRFHRSKILAPAPAIQYCLCSGFLLHRPVCNYLGQFAQKSHFLQNIKKWTPGRWRQTCTLRECLSNTEALSFRISLILLWLLILILQPLQTFVELAGFERVTTTPTEFHISLVYTFSATPRFVRIWAPVPPRETSCDPALPAQLCWSSRSSFPHRLCDSM